MNYEDIQKCINPTKEPTEKVEETKTEPIPETQKESDIEPPITPSILSPKNTLTLLPAPPSPTLGRKRPYSQISNDHPQSPSVPKTTKRQNPMLENPEVPNP